MQAVVAFLRGVNMAGHNSIKMADLLDLCKKIGFKDAETYIQSGNIIFTDNRSRSTVETELFLQNSIKKKFSLDVVTIIRTAEELGEILKKNPYPRIPGSDHSRIAVIVLKEKPTSAQIEKMAGIDYPPDKFLISEKEIFIHCPDGFGKTKLYTNFFENKMKVAGTARNWKTITSLAEIVNRK